MHTYTYTRQQWERIIDRIESVGMDNVSPKYLRRQLERSVGPFVTIKAPNDHVDLVVGMVAVLLGLFSPEQSPSRTRTEKEAGDPS